MQISSVSVWGDSIGKCVVFDEARGRYAICKDNYASHLKAGGVTVENHSVMGYTVCQAQLAEKDMRQRLRSGLEGRQRKPGYLPRGAHAHRRVPRQAGGNGEKGARV